MTDSDSLEFVEYETDAGVATMRLNRPAKKNAINDQMRDELTAALARFEDGDAAALIVRGTDDAFSTGADINDLEDRIPETTPEAVAMSAYSLPGHIENLEKPVIAMINGVAVGGGLELALACDIRIAARNTQLGFPEITLGGLPGEGGTQRLPRETNVGTAMWLILTGELIDGKRAREEGIVQQVHPMEDLADETMSIARAISEKDRTATLLAKRAVRFADRTEFREGIELEGLFANLIETTPDRREHLNEFLED